MGNIDAKRDWGHAKDYVYMQWLMLQQEKPEDYVIASGQMSSVREFIELSAIELGWNKEPDGQGIRWENNGLNEIGVRVDNNKTVIRIDPIYFRPSEVDQLLGDPSKARDKLGWLPTTSLEELISVMIKHDKIEAAKEYLLIEKNLDQTDQQ